MNRTKKFFYNSLSTAILQIVTMIVGLITPRVILKSYGSEINGLVSSINQFISYFNLVEAGLASAAVYSLYKPLADNDYKAINSIVSAARKFYNQSGYIFISLTIGLAVIYPFYIKTNLLSMWNLALLVLILGVNGALEFFTLSKYRVLLTADQKTYVISIATIFELIANTVIIVVLAHYKVNIVLLRFVALFSIFLRSIILMIYCKIKYKYLDYNEKPNKKALDKRWYALYLQILGSVQSGAPIVILTIILKDLKLISVYSIYNMVVSGICGVLSIFTSGLAASFGDVIAQGERKTLQKAYKEFEFSYYSLITIVYSITFIMITSFINIYTKGITDTNYNMPFVGFLFVLNGLLYNIKTPQGMLVISAGLYKETKLQSTLQSAIIIIAGCALAPFYGLSGILIGSILSNLYRDIDLMFFIPHNVTKLPVKDTAFRILRIFLCVFLTWLPFYFIHTSPQTFLYWLLLTCGIGIYAVVIAFVTSLIFDKTEINNIKKRLTSMIGVKK